MSLDETYLEYPRMQHGMDHARYDWALLEQRPAPQWPGGAPLALWIGLILIGLIGLGTFIALRRRTQKK